MPEAWIIDAVRTPRGRGKQGTGALSGIHPQELMARVLNALAERTGIDRRDGHGRERRHGHHHHPGKNLRRR